MFVQSSRAGCVETVATLRVTVDRGRLHAETRRRIAVAENGEPLEDAQPTVNFGSYAELSRLLSPANLELLEAIAADQPESIRAAAESVDRDYKQVHRNLSELADIGVIELEERGRAKRPVLAYDGLEIEVPFPDPDGRPESVRS